MHDAAVDDGDPNRALGRIVRAAVVDRRNGGRTRVAHASSVDSVPVVLDRYSELHPEVAVGETDGDWPVRNDLIASSSERRAVLWTAFAS